MTTFHNPTGNQQNNDNSDDYANLTPVAGLDDGDFSSSSTVPVHATTASNVQTDTLYLTEKGDTSAISVNDLHQGALGDCFLISSIGELAINNPSFISNMIHVNTDGSETVTLYEAANGHAFGTWAAYGVTASKAVQVNVTNVFARGVNFESGQDVVNGQKEIWPQVLEKAYATLNGGYNAISGGGLPIAAMETLTGKVAIAESSSSLTLTALLADVKAGDLITMDTPGGNNKLPNGLVGDHSYMFEGVTGTGSGAMVHLGNPWGTDQPTPIAFSQLSKCIGGVDIGHA